ncbi:MAG: hypothetical protein ACKOGA_08450 [Planctomycetaceae bacterium]
MRRFWFSIVCVGLSFALSGCEQPKPPASSTPAVSPEEMQKTMMKGMAPGGPSPEMIEKAKAAGAIPEGTALPGEAAKEAPAAEGAKEEATPAEPAKEEPATEAAPEGGKK